MVTLAEDAAGAVNHADVEPVYVHSYTHLVDRSDLLSPLRPCTSVRKRPCDAPTPAGVPVAMMSPGSSVIVLDSHADKLSRAKIHRSDYLPA